MASAIWAADCSPWSRDFVWKSHSCATWRDEWGQPPADAELDWLEEFADDLEQEVARYQRYAAGGVLSNEAHRAVQREGARLLAQAARLRELAAALEGP